MSHQHIAVFPGTSGFNHQGGEELMKNRISDFNHPQEGGGRMKTVLSENVLPDVHLLIVWSVQHIPLEPLE